MKKFQPVSLTHGDVRGNAFGNYGHGDDHKGIPEQEQVPVGESEQE